MKNLKFPPEILYMDCLCRFVRAINAFQGTVFPRTVKVYFNRYWKCSDDFFKPHSSSSELVYLLAASGKVTLYNTMTCRVPF